MLARLTVMISQFIQIPNHYVVHMKHNVIPQFFKKLSFEKKKGNDESMNQSYKFSLIAKNII